jgi:chromate transport protein ChrA
LDGLDESMFFEIMPELKNFLTLCRLLIHEISSTENGYVFHHQPSTFVLLLLLTAYHHVNSHFVIHSFFYAPPAIIALVVHISATKKFCHCSELNTKMHNALWNVADYVSARGEFSRQE